jgi:hypothetical protein
MTVVVTIMLAIVSAAIWGGVAMWADVVGLPTDDPFVGPLAAFIGIGVGLLISTWGNA